MNTLEELQDKYKKSSAEVDRVKRELQEEASKTATTRREIAAVKSSIQDLTAKSINAPKLARFGRAPVAGIIESQKQLKEEIEQKQAELKGLESILFTSSSLGISGLLQNEMTTNNRRLNAIRGEIIKLKFEPLATEITETAGEPLKKMALFLLSMQTPQEESDDVYKTIGLEICKKLFGEQHRFKAKLPDAFQAKQQVNELIGI